MPHIREHSHARPAEGPTPQDAPPGDHPPRHGRRPARLRAALTVAAVLAATATAGHAAATAAQITVVEDATTSVVATSDGTVAEVLARTGRPLRPHDRVTPAPNAQLHHGDTIRLVRAKDVTVVIDGHPRPRTVAATTVAEAAAALARSDAAVTASRGHDRDLPGHSALAAGTTFTVVLPKVLFVRADGRLRAVATTTPTIPAVLAKADVAPDRDDIVRAPSATGTGELADGDTVTVVRVRKTRTTTRTALAVPTRKVIDKKLAKGRTAVRVKGKVGALTRTVETVWHDGRKHSARVVATKTVKAVPKVVAVGAYVAPKATKPKTSPRPKAAPKPATPRPGSAAARNWAALAHCESSGNPRALSPGGTYRGLYQFDLATWRSVGGTGDPAKASAAEQTKRAQILYTRRGAAPWPVCGRHL